MKAITPIIFLLRIYKQAISPYLPAVCRFEPSCSMYAMDAYQEHGIFRGSLLTLKRLVRCQPFSKGGFDPVPPGAHRSH